MDRSRKRKVSKQFLRGQAKNHLKKFIQLYLDSFRKNSIELWRVYSFTHGIWDEMEAECICYLKRMPNGEIRIFKEPPCCCTFKKWKKCPEYRCLIWPCDEGSECPYNEEELTIKIDAEIVLDEECIKENQPDERRENSSE